jgi:hypothetical protein
VTRLAAEQSFLHGKLRYYEDYPYAGRYSVETFIANEKGEWEADITPLSEEGLAAKIQAVGCFQSQLSTFFNNKEDLKYQIQAYTQAVGGEKIWYRRNG